MRQALCSINESEGEDGAQRERLKSRIGEEVVQKEGTGVGSREVQSSRAITVDMEHRAKSNFKDQLIFPPFARSVAF